jgi:erythromycin esterase
MATFLGKDLYEELGDQYFAIGTDFYISDCNLPGKDGRITVEFCSDDPLAYNMKDTGMQKGLINFSEVSEESDLYNFISKKIPTGSVGEGYSFGMEKIKRTHEINFAPTDMYDAMILYYETSPTEIWTD